MNNTKNIFIVEDSMSMGYAIEKHLVKEFGELVAVHQFDTVAQVLGNTTLTPDIMFLDHILQDTKGVDFIRPILNKYADLKIAVISGQNDIKVFTKAYANGALDYIRKDALVFHKISDFVKLHLNID